MKQLLPILLGLFLMVSLTAHSQSSKGYCEEVTKSATKLAKKIKKKHILNASENYSSALMAIEKAKANYPKQEFGYDKLVAEIPSWIRMYKALDKLDGNKIVDKKGNTFEFVVVDYKPLMEESTKKAGEAHFNAGKKLMSSENFDDVQKGFSQFQSAQKYVKTYDAEIDNYMLEAYYTQGVKVLNSSTEFSEKEKSIAYFNKALAIKNPYKDVNDLCADFYFKEGARLSKKETLDELRNSVIYLRKSIAYKDNEEAKTMVDADLNAGAEIIYQMAVEQEKEESFEAQAQAAKTYEACEGWVKGYKDASKRASDAKNRSYVCVIIIGSDGKIIDNIDLVTSMNKELNKNISVELYGHALEEVDLNDEANYVKAADGIMGRNYFVYIKLGESQGGKYSKGGPTTTEEDITAYYVQEQGKAAKKVGKKEWDKGKKADDLTGHTSGMKFTKYTGKVKTTKEWTSYAMNYNIEIIDARNPEALIKIGTVLISKTVFDTRKKQTYTGASQAKPLLINDNHKLLSEAELKAQIEKDKTDIASLLKTETGITPKYMEVVKLLNENIKYVKVK